MSPGSAYILVLLGQQSKLGRAVSILGLNVPADCTLTDLFQSQQGFQEVAGQSCWWLLSCLWLLAKQSLTVIATSAVDLAALSVCIRSDTAICRLAVG